MLSQLGFFFEMDSSRLLAVLVSNSMEAFPIVCYCIVLVKKSSFYLTLTQLKKQQQHMNFHFQVRTKQNKNVFQSHCSMEKKSSSQILSKSKVDSSSVISKMERGHFMLQKASIFCVSPEAGRLVPESVLGGEWLACLQAWECCYHSNCLVMPSQWSFIMVFLFL